ncbi:MAG: D-glycero-beta-D-manno-heptose 1,7-bisphosphate 7-phosphatase [Proteobacteria bacterium]|nr:D-glycero-beta-D-manno-heptose 1,7-bisphosphate 7-phosphatase [Pseudomonadota bacterium]MBU1059363.1 D-glycero-beta-D-manno-heptose 1,7-bisphosphate 7-phosphatase [Pseudomonadota bacterium]
MTDQKQNSAPRAAVFLDRDGTINEQMGYINHTCRFQLLPGAAEAIKKLNDAGIPVVVVSNQSGLARGYFPEELLLAVHEKMARLLAEKGAHVDGIYYCPHHPEAKEKKFREVCSCRKPKPGLILQAAEEMNLAPERSFVVGDRWSDIKTAANCGARSILVRTGYGRGDELYIGPHQEIQPDYKAEDLLEAVAWILHS